MNSSDETLVLFDLDRTLINTDLITHYLADSVLFYEGKKVADEFISELKLNKGKSFNSYDYLRKVVPGSFSKIVDHFTSGIAAPKLLNPGASQLLQRCRRRGVRVGILTFGDQDYQVDKLKAGGLGNVPYMVTGVSGRKSHIIVSWYDSDLEKFLLPHEFGQDHVRSIVLVDDKPSELQVEHANFHKVLYAPERQPSGVMSDGVRVVSRLAEVSSVVDNLIGR